MRNTNKPHTVTVHFDPSQRRWSLNDPNGRFKPHRQMAIGKSTQWEWDTVTSPFPQSIMFPIRYRFRHRLEFGPVVGILASEHGKTFRGNSKNFEDIVAVGKELGTLVYVFTPNGWDERSAKVGGFAYNPLTKKWVEGVFPLPHVVYNRIPFREDEEVPKVKQLLQRLRNHPQIKMFNPSFFNKEELFNWIRDDRSIQSFLPLTRRLRDRFDVEKMVREFSIVYLKPATGMAGSGIMRIDMTKERQYKLTQQKDRGSESSTFATLPKLWRHIHSTVSATPYLIQQGIRLSTYKGRAFDIRTLLQKDRAGQWRITGIGARVAGKESITTHVPRGGAIGRPYDLLKARHGNKAMQILRNVEQAALALAKAIEYRGSQSLGEMSMDLAIDEAGNPWFLEANSKPMKFDEPQIRKTSLERIIEYCSYLAGYSDNQR